jgi:cytochrome c
MFMHNVKLVGLAALLSSISALPIIAQEAEGQFGTPATEEEIAAIDIDIMPDGTGLPEGSGSYSDGQEVYEMTCAACHGEDMAGVKDLGAPALIGGRDTLATDAPVKTIESYWPHASTVFDYIRRAMPMNAPGSLTDDETYAVTAYILGRANIVSEDIVLDADSFTQIEMPNKDGFFEDPRPESY